MDTKYKTLTDIKEVKINISKSVFIADGLEVDSIIKAQEFISNLKEKYINATHYCSAYIIDNQMYADDNGEPAGTAGLPILNVIKRNNLNNIIIVVARYFGGKKLGVRGLIEAYRQASENLIANSIIVERVPGIRFTILCDYNYANKLSNIKDDRIRVIEKKYTDKVIMTVFIESSLINVYENEFTRDNVQIISKTETVN